MRRAQHNAYSQSPYAAYQRPPEAPYGEEPEPYVDEPPYEEPYAQDQPYDDDQGYGAEQPYYEEQTDGEELQEPELVSTCQAVNLTCTMAAFSGLFAFFLYIADRRSEAVRRISVQSVALTGGFLCASVILLIVGTLFRFVPFLGVVIAVIFWLLFAALLLITVYLKVKMMLHAYRGLAYQLPFIGGYVRRFE